ncbi:MAG: DUF3099 domain-containing protein [Actinomycetota bacterium]|nr:DUF3099 domain-containing protein [Actinomycetota bacterium]
MRSQRGAKPDTFRITTAPVSRQADIAFRQRRYVISMGVRTLCFLGAVFVGDNWVRWVLVAASFVLPYVAVVMANSASPVVDAAPVEGPGLQRKELGHPGS